MTQNKTLSWSYKVGGLQMSKSDIIFHFLQTVLSRLFLCPSVNSYNYLTKNHNQQWLFHLKTVV